MQRLQRQMDIDRRWDSAIDRIEIKYGLHLDDWKRLGRDQMGQKCGRGWVGLRGACERGKKADDNTEKIKKSKRALADKIRARKGLRDRNAPKAEDDSLQRLERLIALKKTPPQTASIASSSINQPEPQQSNASKNRESQRLKEGSKVVAGGLTRKELDDFSFESVGRRSVGQLSELPNGQIVTFRGEGRSRRSSGIPDGDYFQVTKTTKSGSTYGIPLDKSGKAISDKSIRLKNVPAKWLEVADVDEDQKKYGTFGSVEELNTKYGRSDSDDSTHFDAAEITRYTRAIASLNDRYGWHIDAQKVLSKLGKKLGKKCGKGWISPEKKCKSHYTNGKLNESGKASGENLADRIRQRKKLSTVSRDGKGKELAYAFLPGSQKQSSMTARRTHAPRSGYQTPGRLSKTNSTEERRSMVGLGQNPGTRSKPDNAPIMDLPTRPASAPIESRTRKLNANPSAGDRIRAVAQTLKEQDKIQKGATVGVLKVAEKLYINQNKMIAEVSTMVNKDLDRAAAKGGKKMFEPTPPQSDPVAKASGGSSTGEPRTRRMNTAVVGSSAGDRIRAIAGKLKDEESVQAGATVGILKVAEKLYTNQNKMIKEVVGIVNEDLNNAAAKGVRKMFDPTQTPVRIPNQRSSSEPRKRGRSVD